MQVPLWSLAEKYLKMLFKGFHTFKGIAGDKANPGKSIPYGLVKEELSSGSRRGEAERQKEEEDKAGHSSLGPLVREGTSPKNNDPYPWRHSH